MLLRACIIIGFLRSASGSHPRVVGGFSTNITTIPYHVGLEYYGNYYCSGSIISKSFVLTAAHCVDGLDPDEIRIRSGTSERGQKGVIIKMRKFFRHPKFSTVDLDYDVAVVEVEDVPWKSVRIGQQEPRGGESLIISGWGKLNERGELAGVLQSTEVKILDRSVCEELYLGKLNITKRMFCAGKDGRDSCDGDSGAPATSEGELVGVVSWGIGCGRGNYPGVYTNLLNEEIRDFIRKISGI